MENRNDVSSFFYYMWNAWCRNECIICFTGSPAGWEHFWEKWLDVCSRNESNRFGAVEEFFSELSECNKDLLVDRAVRVYNRGTRIWTRLI